MATFRKRGKTIQAQIRVRGAKPLSATFPTLKEAESWAASEEQRLRETKQGLSQIEVGRLANHIKLEEVLREYAEVSKPLSHHSEYALRYALVEPIAKKTIGTITKRDALVTKGRYLERFCPATAAKYLHYIKRTIDYVVEQKDLQSFVNVFKSILCARDKKRWTRFTPEEQTIFMRHTTNELLIDFVEFALETAMRRGEIINMRQNHLLPSSKLYIPDTKTDRPRIIPLTEKALEITERRLEVNGPVVFPVLPAVISRQFKGVCEAAELIDKRVHDLRREALSRYSAAGLNTHQLMQLSGHRDINSLSIYVRGNVDELQRKMLDAVNGVL